MKKGQLFSQPFMYIFAIVVIALIFLFGFQMIGKLKSTTCSVENIKFITDLNNEIDRIYSQGFSGSSTLCSLVPRSRVSDSSCEIIIPQGLDGVCILDPTKSLDYTNIPFEEFANDIKLLQGHTDKNLYFISENKNCDLEKIPPVKIQNVEIKETICVKSNEVVKIVIENKGRNVEIRKVR